MNPANRTAVVIEGEPLVAACLAKVVKDLWGQNVLIKPTLEAASKDFDPSGVDLVLLDAALAENGVCELADRLLESSIAYVFVTAQNRASISVRHRGAPCVSKPIDESKLRAAILEALATAARRRRGQKR